MVCPVVSDLNIFVWKWSKIAKQKNSFLVDYALQNIFLDVFEFLPFRWFFSVIQKIWGFWVFLVHPETTLSDGLKTSGQRVYRKFCHISRCFWVFAFWMILFSFFVFCFWVFLVHPTVVLVLLSALVKRCFVSRMRDFFVTIWVFVFSFFLCFSCLTSFWVCHNLSLVPVWDFL